MSVLRWWCDDVQQGVCGDCGGAAVGVRCCLCPLCGVAYPSTSSIIKKSGPGLDLDRRSARLMPLSILLCLVAVVGTCVCGVNDAHGATERATRFVSARYACVCLRDSSATPRAPINAMADCDFDAHA